MSHLDQPRCFIRLREELTRQIGETLTLGSQANAMEVGFDTAFLDLVSLFKDLQKLGRKTVVILDDFDVMAANPHLDASFFSSLRALPNDYDIAYLIASQSPLDELENNFPRLNGSPFFNIFFEQKLAPFEAKVSRQMIDTILKRAAVRFPKIIVEHILELGCNQLFRLQLAGHHAFIAALCELRGYVETKLAAAELAAFGLNDLTDPEPVLVNMARVRLVILLEEPTNRATASRALALLGDPRDFDELVLVPAGPFFMGDNADLDARLQLFVRSTG